MSHRELAARRPSGTRLRAIRYAIWSVVFLVAVQSAPASTLGCPQPIPSAGQRQGPQILYTASFLLSMGLAPQVGISEENGTVASVAGLKEIQTAIGHVHTPSLPMLADALGMSSAQIGQRAFEDSTTGMETVSGLSGGPVVAVKWRASAPEQTEQSGREPNLYLFSWDGEAWRASYLTPAANALTLQVLPVTGGMPPMFAVVIFRSITAVPYPVVFRFHDHQASLVWDGRSESSLYTGYDYGSIQFEKAGGRAVPLMVATGRADPGLLIFPTSPEPTRRGFQAAAIYAWQNNAYVPIRTEYANNRDYTIYRFIAALHLHDFKAAYSLIDPTQFLKTKKPSLKLFRERIQNVWPEFTDDKIFEVPEQPEKGSEDHVFILRLGHGKMNVYHPTFTNGPAHRLTSLQRTELTG